MNILSWDIELQDLFIVTQIISTGDDDSSSVSSFI